MWLNLVLDAIKSSHQHGSECQVRVAGWIWATEFDALGLWIAASNRNT